MSRLSFRSSYPLSLLSVLVLLGCQQSATAPADRHVSQTDLKFVTGLTNLVEFDHRVIDTDVNRSSDPRVQALAKDLLTRVDSFNARVMPIAARDGISPPTDMSLFAQSDMHTRVAAIMATSKYDFDQEFLSDELAANREILSDAEQAIAEPGGDPELRVLLTEAVVRLRSDVARLTDLQAQLKG